MPGHVPPGHVFGFFSPDAMRCFTTASLQAVRATSCCGLPAGLLLPGLLFLVVTPSGVKVTSTVCTSSESSDSDDSDVVAETSSS